MSFHVKLSFISGIKVYNSINSCKIHGLAQVFNNLKPFSSNLVHIYSQAKNKITTLFFEYPEWYTEKYQNLLCRGVFIQIVVKCINLNLY